MDIAFHPTFDFHRAVLEPVYVLLKDRFQCLVTSQRSLIPRLSPRILVVADREYPDLRQALPDTLFIWLRHGFSSKNNFRPSVEEADIACLNSEWTRQWCVENRIMPRVDFWTTGFVPSDRLFQKPAAIQLFNEKKASDKIVLYAPTYNVDLNSVGVLGTDWIDRLMESASDIKLIIKPHPVIPQRHPDWMSFWTAASVKHSNVVLIEEGSLNIYELLGDVDLLISDASSVVFYFLALNKPIILVTNPQPERDECFFDPNGPEWTWRDMADTIDSSYQIVAQIRESLTYPCRKEDRRKYYAERVYGDLFDGKSAQRVAQKIAALLEPAQSEQLWSAQTWRKFIASRGESDCR